MRVTSLHLYPVKSFAGVDLHRSAVDARGLRGDRRWAVVDPVGNKVTAREVHDMLGLRAEPMGGDGIRIVDRSGASLTVTPPRGAPVVRLGFSGQPEARPASEESATWLSRRLGGNLRLVWQDDVTSRPIRPELGGDLSDTNSLSDAAPLHLTTQASLDRLNDWLAAAGTDPLGHDRFRPNVVVDGDEPFAEDDWPGITIGDVSFRHTMVCDRCVMTTIDRSTLESAKEPIRTLARHRRWDGATWFGIRLTPVLPVPDGAVLQVGDRVVVWGR